MNVCVRPTGPKMSFANTWRVSFRRVPRFDPLWEICSAIIPQTPLPGSFSASNMFQEILCSFLVVKKQLITVNQNPRFQSSPTAHLSIRAVATLNGDLNTLDSEYNTLSNHMAEGERDSFDKPCLNGIV